MTFEERIKQALAEMHFANLQMQQRVEQLQQENGTLVAALAKLQAEQAPLQPTPEKELPAELRANGGDKRPRTT